VQSPANPIKLTDMTKLQPKFFSRSRSRVWWRPVEFGTGGQISERSREGACLREAARQLIPRIFRIAIRPFRRHRAAVSSAVGDQDRSVNAGRNGALARTLFPFEASEHVSQVLLVDSLDGSAHTEVNIPKSIVTAS
jgi:hypothetical protein